MTKVLQGVRVLEVSTFGFVPSGGAALADLGADVIKVEHPAYGDPIRHIPCFGIAPGTGGLTLQWEAFNRGKRSVALDLKDPEARAVLLELARSADVFVTNYLPQTRRKLRIDVEDIRAANPKIIYARGHGQGVNGPEAEAGGFDVLSFWYRTGIADAVSVPGLPAPPLPAPAFGDVLSGLTLAGGIAAALFHRERGGEPTVVDVSLLGTGLWAMQIGIIAADQVDHETMRGPKRQIPGNPLVHQYLTSDRRLVALCFLDPQRHWKPFCVAIDRPELADDPRFADTEARRMHEDECVAVLAEEFARRSLAQWREILTRQEGQWAVSQTEAEVVSDPQTVANGYLTTIEYPGGLRQRVVPAPMQFDEEVGELKPAPTQGQHTDEVLDEAGIPAATRASLRERKALR
ncbi:CaiB/BaiF CoA transferase family protein [Dactylosporangium sucinum]|uniref:CoA transferase n=1 Tax=Dactylosporangium sucinum TaxID=1424081 RepID=A0A917U9S7_9ACTN|nr:CoA transferase [Dactylosporangium sucinum]GGM64583.1 CoA transferase [Dactylosporangium sucinum]